MRSPLLTAIKIPLAGTCVSLLLSGCAYFPSLGNLPGSDSTEPPVAKSPAESQKKALHEDAAPLAPRTADIVGSWIEDVPGQTGRKQGYKFNADGSASSIGMATLDVKRWTLKGDRLTIYGDSIGNGMTIPFEFEFLVTNYSADTLELEQGSYRHSLKRR